MLHEPGQRNPSCRTRAFVVLVSDELLVHSIYLYAFRVKSISGTRRGESGESKGDAPSGELMGPLDLISFCGAQ